MRARKAELVHVLLEENVLRDKHMAAAGVSLSPAVICSSVELKVES